MKLMILALSQLIVLGAMAGGGEDWKFSGACSDIRCTVSDTADIQRYTGDKDLSIRCSRPGFRSKTVYYNTSGYLRFGKDIVRVRGFRVTCNHRSGRQF